MSTYRDYFKKRMAENPEFRETYEDGEPDFQIMYAIASARADTGMTQKEVAEKSGIIQAEISKMENGNANPSLKTLKKLAKGLNMKLVIRFEPLPSQINEEPIPLEIVQPETDHFLLPRSRH